MGASMSGLLDGIGEVFARILKILGLFILAGIIGNFILIGITVLTGSFADKVTGLVMIGVLDMIPFPLNLYLSSQLNLTGFILELFLQIIIFLLLFIFLEKSNGRH